MNNTAEDPSRGRDPIDAFPLDRFARLRSAAHEFMEAAREPARTRPYAWLGVAAGVGYVLGGGLNSSLTKHLTGQLVRAAVGSLVTSLVSSIVTMALEPMTDAGDREDVDRDNDHKNQEQ